MAFRAFSTLVIVLVVSIFYLSCVSAGETILSTILTPNDELETDLTSFYRQGRSDYYDQARYGANGQFLDRLAQYETPRCGRCLDDRYDDREDPYDRSNRDRYDDERRQYHRPTYGNRHDKNRDGNEDRYDNSGRNGSERKNDTNEEGSDDQRDKRPHDGKDDRKHAGGGRRDRDRNRYDDRDRYHPDYYDRFLRDPYRERNPYKGDPYRERDPYGYEDPYRERRPLFDRYPYGESYDDHYDNYRRPLYDSYDRGNGYDDRGYGGRGRGPHDSFRPWDETYRGQAGWDAAGRGYYFAGGRPDSAPAAAWTRPDYRDPYARPDAGGWQNVDRPYREGTEYRGTLSYPQDYAYRQELDATYRPLGWAGYGERRPYRDQSSQVPKGQALYGQSAYGQASGYGQGSYEQSGGYGQNSYTQSGGYGQSGQGQSIGFGQGGHGQSAGYGQGGHAQSAGYGQGGHAQSAGYGQGGHAQSAGYVQGGHTQFGSYGHAGYGQSGSTGTGGYGQTSSTTPGTSYLFQREDELVTKDEVSTKSPS